MSMRYLLLAEGSSGDPLYGKTMRGVLRYRREDVVAILDSTRAGETEDGVPIVGDASRKRSQLGPTTALVGVVTQGGYFPPAWMELLRTCVEHGLDVENGLHVFLADDPELAGLAAERGVELRDLRRPPAGLSTATGENLAVDATIVLTVGSDCAIGKMTVSLRARPRGAAARAPLGLRPDGTDGNGDRRLGHRGRRGRGRLRRRRGRAARRRGAQSAAASCSGSRARARSCTRSTPASRSASTTGAFRTCSSSATRPAARRSRAPAEGRTRSRRCATSSSCTSGSRCRRARRASPRSRSTRARSARRRRVRRSRRRRRRRACPPTIRSASEPRSSSTPCSRRLVLARAERKVARVADPATSPCRPRGRQS